MSFTVEVIESVYLLNVETAISDQVNELEIETSTSNIIEISTDYAANVVFAGDIIGLDTYIANFIDDYEIDCGTP